MTATILSSIGMIMNSPGPLTPCSLPARRTTNFCQVLAILSANAMKTATITNGMPQEGCPMTTSTAPTAPKTTVRNAVMGFMIVLPAQSGCPAQRYSDRLARRLDDRQPGGRPTFTPFSDRGEAAGSGRPEQTGTTLP